MLLNTTINLLSKQKRGRLEHLTKFIFVRDILEIVLLIYTMLAITLLWSWIVLQEDFNNLAESSTLVNREYSRYNQEIRDVNSLIRNLNKTSQIYLPLAPKLSEIIQGLPKDIKLNAINIDRNLNNVTFSGTALTRDALLEYQEQIKKIGWLEKFETPASQLFQKENINFEMRAKLKNVEPLKPQTQPRVNRIIED